MNKIIIAVFGPDFKTIKTAINLSQVQAIVDEGENAEWEKMHYLNPTWVEAFSERRGISIGEALNFANDVRNCAPFFQELLFVACFRTMFPHLVKKP